MKAFFWLSAAADRKHSNYRVEVERMAKGIGLDVVFNDDKTATEPRDAWIAEQIGEADFCFFDVTGADPDCLVALGVALGQDAQAFALRDADEGSVAIHLINVKSYFGPDDFQRKAKLIIESTIGSGVVQNKVLIENIKERLRKLGPLPVRRIAHEVRRDLDEVRPVVFSMVDAKTLEKVSDKRWARYALRN